MSKLYGVSNYMAGILEDIEVSRLNQPVNPVRLSIDGIEELANSIKRQGLLNPLTVRIKNSQNFEIVAGTRRFHACKLLGWRKIPCHVVSLDEKESFEVSLIENIQRHSMNAFEEAKAYKRYISDFGWGGITDIATKIGKSPSYITKKIQLLDLHPSVLESVVDSTLKSSIAEELCSIKDKTNQVMLAEVITTQKLSFRKSRRLMKSYELYPNNTKSKDEIRIEKITKSFDKAIVSLRISMNRLAEVIENNTENDFIVKTLMYHKNLLHEQIDSLIKDKRKTAKNGKPD